MSNGEGPANAAQTTDSTAPSSPLVSLGRQYAVASHSVRLTKHGFAIEPLELRYPEIAANLSLAARRASDVSFDPAQVANRMLSVIRGFWSQPAFPRGKLVKSPPLASIGAVLNEFSLHPLYPHQATFSDLAASAPEPPNNKSRRQRISLTSIQDQILAASAASQSASSPAQSFSSPASDSSQSTSPALDIDEHNELLRDISGKFKTLSSKSADTSQTRKANSLFTFLTSTTPATDTAKTQSSAPSSVSSSQRRRRHSTGSSRSRTFQSWIPTDRGQMIEQITLLCHKTERIFAGEARIVSIESPCVVLGDIHGNLHDLRTYERCLWPKAPACLSSSYLFLGDYVDRGEYSVECVLYLFAMKVIAPDKFYLLRGNHEVSAIQKQYTFGRECDAKFGADGKQIWRLFNRVFDSMPIAAVVDSQVFCGHGGIPKSIQDLAVLADSIPCPMPNPETQCASAWEILWNDPITDNELIGMLEMDSTILNNQPNNSDANSLETTDTSQQLSEEATATTTKQDSEGPDATLSGYIQRDDTTAAATNTTSQTNNTTASHQQQADEASASTTPTTTTSEEIGQFPSDTSSITSQTPQSIINDGFITNIKRGTAYLFSDKAVKNFLALNNLSHVIRAHEVIPTGFAFHGDGRVITIFSSSRYCGLNNQAACCLIDNHKIRILRLDTGDAGE